MSTNHESTTGGGGPIGMFQSEITSMMYTFGDIKSCNSETVALVEHITHRQIVEMIQQTSQVTVLRGGKSMSVSDVLFLFRKDKQKLKQIVRHLQLKEMIQRARSQSRSDDEESSGYDPFPGIGSDNKKQKFTLDFLLESDQKDILNEDDVDLIHQQRQERLDSQTKSMDLAQYEEFAEMRRMNFNKNTAKFKEWLDINTLIPSYKPSQAVIELFGYLAYETVQEIVELALLVKQDQEPKLHDPTSTITPLTNATPIPYGATPTFVTTPASMTGGGISSPGSPKSPFSSGISSPTQLIIKAKPRKRGRPSKTSVSELAPPTATPTAIQPAHIHEVLRRCTMAPVGPHLPLTSHFIKPSFINRTICL